MHLLEGQDRRRLIGHVRQSAHEIIEGLHRPRERILKDDVQTAVLGLTREQADAEFLCGLQISRKFGQHGYASGYMKPANANRDATLAKAPGEIDRSWKLIGLNTGKGDESFISGIDGFHDIRGTCATIRFVERGNHEFRSWAQHLSSAAVLRDAIEARQRIGGYRRSQPLDRIPIVIVMCRLDQDEVKGRPAALHHPLPLI